MEKMRYVDNDTGFSLLEVLIAMVIMSIGLLGVAAMQINAIGGNAYGAKLNAATERIQTKMEDMRKLGYDAIVSEVEDADDAGFTRTTIVTADTPVPNTKTIVVQVAWNDRTGTKAHQIAFRTIIAK